MPRLRPKLILLPLILFVAATLVPSYPAHLHSGEFMVPGQWQDANPGPYIISLTVVVDEDWQRMFGVDSEEQARLVVERSAAQLRPANIDLRFATLKSWTSSDDDGLTLHSVLDTLERSHTPLAADMVLGLTAGQYEGNVDGVARPRSPYVVVKHHPRRGERDAYVLTHEIGHVLGLDHHACPDGRCIMADHKYDPQAHWCSDHLELLKGNGGYFHYLRDAGSQV
ncbi:MAG: hypothetical protein V3S20_03815 [Dehalococcoidia bacterium]